MEDAMRSNLIVTMLAVPLLAAPANAVEVPDAIAATGETLVTTVHAQGAQVYECQFNAFGDLAWQFREPIATLLVKGKTVGRHYAGPTWEMSDGSVITATVAGRAQAASMWDIPMLKLTTATRRGSGQLDEVTTVQRINTSGGVADEPCPYPGAYLSVPYTADYAFYRKRS
jgi:hypothetical protein